MPQLAAVYSTHLALEYFKDRNGLEAQLLELSRRVGIKENRR